MIVRGLCGTWAGIRAHQEAGEALCGACHLCSIAAESLHQRPTPRKSARAVMRAEYPPLTPAMQRENRRVLAQALECVDDIAASDAA